MEQKGAMNMTKTRKNTRDDKNSNIKSAEEISLFEKSKYGLDLVNGWISSADSKIGTFGAVYAVVVAVFVYIADKFFATVDCTNVINPILLQWSKYSAIAAIVSVLITIFFCLWSLSPSFTSVFSKKQCTVNQFSLFYDDVAKVSSVGEYVKLAKEVSDEQFTEEIMKETYYNSEICSKKMHRFKKGVIAAVSSILFYAGWILFFYLAY